LERLPGGIFGVSNMREPSVPEEVMPSLFANIGMIVMNWSFVENSLDAWTAIAYQNCNGASVERELPRMFDRKVRFLRKCFNRLPELAPWKDDALHYLDRARALSETRHYVVHGVLSDFDKDHDESFTFQKIDLDENRTQHVIGSLTIPGEKLIDAANELLAMANQGHRISSSMLNALEGDNETS
jgi:hypothetical protein